MRTSLSTILTLIVITLVFVASVSIAPHSFASAASASKGTVLITGANRGIGLALAKEFKSRGYDVIGTARTPSDANDLKATGAVVMQLDVTDAKSVSALAEAMKDRKVDILINNAGISVENPSVAKLDIDVVEKTLTVNAIGPMRVTQALLPSLKKGSRKVIVGISSSLGSIAANTNGGYYGYRESKAALNMFMRSLAAELKGDGFVCIAMDPGWVRTDMGGPQALLSPGESASGIVKVIESLKPRDTGSFSSYEGKPRDW